MEKEKINWVRVCIAPRLIKLDYNETIKKSHNYVLVVKEDNVIDSEGREFYNLWLYKQDIGYPIEKGDLQEILDFVNKFDNVEVIKL